MLLEDAQLNWQIGDQFLAKQVLYEALQNKDVESSLCRATALCIYGEYMAKSQTENLKVIIKQFFEGSLIMLEKIKESKNGICERMKISTDSITPFLLENRIKAYETIARYADREHQNLNLYMKSPMFELKKFRIKKNTQTVDEMGKGSHISMDIKITQNNLRKFTEIDKNEIQATETEHYQYLTLALFNYIKACTMQMEPNNSIIFRIISLWFANKTDKKINERLQEECPKIGSYKFMTILPQLVVRISNANDVFSNTVREILGKGVIKINGYGAEYMLF